MEIYSSSCIIVDEHNALNNIYIYILVAIFHLHL